MEKKRSFSLKKELPALLCLLIALGLFCGLSLRVLTPARRDYGAVWGMYGQEPENSLDVLFLGSSLAYCDVVPSVIYEESGLTSFVMAGPEQTAPVTYYYLRETLKTQSPKTILLEVTGLFFPPDNRFLKSNLTFMPYNENRLIPTVTETSGSERLGLLFPLYAYHDRWDELTGEDWERGISGYDPDPLAGYTFLDQAAPVEGFTVRDDLDGDPEHFARAVEYLDNIRALCEAEGIRLVCFVSPAAQRMGEDFKERLALALEGVTVELIDFNDSFDSFSFDLGADFYDPRHLNYRGAEKFSRSLAGLLTDWGAVPGGGEDSALWERRMASFESKRDAADAAPVKLNEAAIAKEKEENEKKRGGNGS